MRTRFNYLPSILILLGDWTYPDPYALSILLRNSRMQPTLQHPNFPSNAKPSKISTLAKQIFLSRLTQRKVIIALLHQHSIPTSSSAPQIQRQLHKTSVPSLPLPVIVMLKMLTVSLSNVCLHLTTSFKNLLRHHLQPENSVPWHLHRRRRATAQPQS